MSMPLQLYALTWGQDDSQAIQEWQQEHSDKIQVVGWSRILLYTEPLHTAVDDPSIFGLAIDGVVIRDHKKVLPDSLKQSLKKLSSGMLKLYAVSNGAEPVTAPEPVQY
jgi:hypothetical protein